MTNRDFQDNTTEESQHYGVWVDNPEDTIIQKIMKKVRQIRNTLLIGLGITLSMVIIWMILFLGTANANGPTDLTMPTLHYKGTLISGNNPEYYPKYADIIHLTGDLDYSQPLANATSCYQPIFKQYYGESHSINSGYKVIYDIKGMSHIMRDDSPKILTCSGTSIITVDYNKLVSGIHQ